ncbi:Stk1 family PASTA domain-containing Ser/Thr kinase [Actinotignum schaalii]|nr:Stk1 family PASTA domain-containing Ser/Thr kinase [Actinotignum schaalii]AIE83003.1 serine/threonine protein kinase [Actinotignum schaalii]WQN45151.1 Stk1 family PASTA domain-containing Ser/Thr kinase [Actinotignum schaalii]
MNDIPRVLGNRYQVGDIIGRGGMAEVHLGYDTRLSRTVAIKILRTDLAQDATFLARFRREAQSAAALNHPSIVSVYDTGEETVTSAGGTELALPYIVMEYVKGRTVASLLHGGDPVPIGEAVQIVVGVLSALEYSHHEGIIHRDIKPGNIMLTTGGKVKVMDFGIARAIADSAATMTQTNSVVGTAQYLSPEQARGEVVDARSDLYSTGCVLYELLTGRPPFVGDSAVAVAYQHVSETPKPASQIASDIPDAIDRVVMKSLAKSREDRYQDAAEFRADLLAAARGEGVDAPAVSSWNAYGAGAGIAGAGAGAIAGAGAAGAAGLGGAAGANAATAATQAYSAANGRSDSTTAYPSATTPGGSGRGGAGGHSGAGAGAISSTTTQPGGAPSYPGGYPTGAYPGAYPTGSYPTGSYPGYDPAATGAQPPVKKKSSAPFIWGGVALLVIALGILGWFFLSGRGDSAEPQPTETAVAQVTIPDMTGWTEVQASQQLTSLGLEFVRGTDVSSDTVEKNLLVSSNPAMRSTVDVGTRVTLHFSSGPSAVQVPDVVGMSTDQASQALRAAGLTVGGMEQVNDPSEDSGRVVSTSPNVGESVKPGSTVKLQVASGNVAVPDVRGMSVDEARAALRDARLTVVGQGEQEVSDPAKVGKVVDASIAPGTVVQRDTEMRITVGIAPAPTPTPSAPAAGSGSGGSGSGSSSGGSGGSGGGAHPNPAPTGQGNG